MKKISGKQTKNQAITEPGIIRGIRLSGPLIALLRVLANTLLRQMPEQKFFDYKHFAVPIRYTELAARADMIAAKMTHLHRPYSVRQIARHHRELERLGLARRRRMEWGVWVTEFPRHLVRDVVEKTLSLGARRRFAYWAFVAGKVPGRKRRRGAAGRPVNPKVSKPAEPADESRNFVLPADVDAGVFGELLILLRDLQRLEKLKGEEHRSEYSRLYERKWDLIGRLVPSAADPKRQVCNASLADNGKCVFLARKGGMQIVRLPIEARAG